MVRWRVHLIWALKWVGLWMGSDDCYHIKGSLGPRAGIRISCLFANENHANITIKASARFWTIILWRKLKTKLIIHLDLMTLCLRARPSFPSPFSLTFSPSKRLRCLTLPSSFKPYSHSSPSSGSSVKMSAQTIEHIVLFKVKDDTDPSKVNAMVSGLSSLVSLDQVLHLSVGPLLRNRSSALNFTHMLHSRYSTKDDLNAYSAHHSHVSVVKGSVLPICDDIMAVDWVAHNLQGDLVPPPGSAMRVSFLKLKENLGDEIKNEVLGVISGIKDKIREIRQLSYGENFSPARAKGYSLASLAVFPGPGDLDALDSNEKLVNDQKDKAREHLESVVVVDYVVPPPEARSASLWWGFVCYLMPLYLFSVLHF